MAEMPKETVVNASEMNTRSLWVMATVAGVALVCVTGLAVVLALVLGRQTPATGTQNVGNPVININPSVAPTWGIQRPSEPAKPQATRSSAQDQIQAALPGKLNDVSANKREKQLVRAETQAPPVTAFPEASHYGKYHVRAEAPNLYNGDRALPMPIRVGADAKARPGTPAQATFTRATDGPVPPPQAYAESGATAANLDVQLSGSRKSAVFGEYRAPEGFWFFTTDIKIVNHGAQSIAVDPLSFEVRDQDNACSMGMPEFSTGLESGSVGPGESAQGTLSFLVFDDVDLKALALLNTSVMIPLTKK